jgi:hypothetical protein
MVLEVLPVACPVQEAPAGIPGEDGPLVEEADSFLSLVSPPLTQTHHSGSFLRIYFTPSCSLVGKVDRNRPIGCETDELTRVDEEDGKDLKSEI